MHILYFFIEIPVMRLIWCIGWCCWCALHSIAQKHFDARWVFSHNDYAQATPFYAAYGSGVGYIEADIFLEGQMLLVAHAKSDLDTTHTLQSMYLNPLNEQILKNGNRAYPGRSQTLSLMIDIKSEAISTLTRLVQALDSYPAMIHAKGLRIVISGNRPEADQWRTFPGYIYFDGRPDHAYSSSQWKRIAFVSDDFKKYSEWNGDGPIAAGDAAKVHDLLTVIHRKHKMFRFWATPDKRNVWSFLIQSGVDIFGTDMVNELIQFLQDQQ